MVVVRGDARPKVSDRARGGDNSIRFPNQLFGLMAKLGQHAGLIE